MCLTPCALCAQLIVYSPGIPADQVSVETGPVVPLSLCVYEVDTALDPQRHLIPPICWFCMQSPS